MENTVLFGYLDPGTLTFLMQCLVAIFITCLVSGKVFFGEIRRKTRLALSKITKKGGESAALSESTAPSSDVDSSQKSA